VRESLALPAIDPGYGVPTFDAKMIERGPHKGMKFQRDYISVWNVIRHVTHERPGWSWASEDVKWMISSSINENALPGVPICRTHTGNG
jgi:starvation-inducible outer membrane lipoprotein